MFSFIAILIFSLLWIFILMQLIDRIFIINKKIKVQPISLLFMIISLLLSFSISIISFYFVLILLFKMPFYLGLETKKQSFETMISNADCLPLTNAIKQTESNIGLKENHRHLEETAHLFTIKLEYQKAAKKLTEQAKLYSNLELSIDSQPYSQKIAANFAKQADLFRQRTAITTNKAGIKQVYKILEKMDRVNQERLRLVNQVKRQCDNAT